MGAQIGQYGEVSKTNEKHQGYHTPLGRISGDLENGTDLPMHTETPKGTRSDARVRERKRAEREGMTIPLGLANARKDI